MAIQQTINHYLDAVERRLGAAARQQTTVKHRGGRTFLLKRADATRPQLVDMGTLSRMTAQLHSAA